MPCGRARSASRPNNTNAVDALYLLIPLSVLLVLGIGGVLAWSVLSGQFDDLEAEGRRILDDNPPHKTNGNP
jgi:cbb3-type cytochrome oxidase maturation protein